ncbi:MAG: hypothetical protein JW717_02990, partial [Marinilabiliaceae bacterium]|nr:hypothetical protein [Marinilabiliaceae bacterium]
MAAEGMVVGWGCQTLAFVRWHFPYFFSVFLQQKYLCHMVAVFFCRLVGNGRRYEIVGDCGLLSCPVTLNSMRGRTLE